MYEFHKKPEGPPARSASTLLVVREVPEFQLFFVVRHKRSAFLGGAMVFPGGKLDDDDALVKTTGVPERALRLADERPELAEALAVCACRETLEEAGLCPTKPGLPAERIEELRQSLLEQQALSELLGETQMDTESLVPFARWVTPEAETRRYDARFFLTRCPPGQVAKHDNHETTRGLWASPAEILASFEVGEVFLAPPTLRCLELLAPAQTYADAVAIAAQQSLLPICPKLLAEEPLRLVLPGHAEHSIPERRVAGSTAFVLTDGRFLSADTLD